MRLAFLTPLPPAPIPVAGPRDRADGTGGRLGGRTRCDRGADAIF